MSYDPTDGCPGCGTLDRNHDPDCEHDNRPPEDDGPLPDEPGPQEFESLTMSDPTQFDHLSDAVKQKLRDRIGPRDDVRTGQGGAIVVARDGEVIAVRHWGNHNGPSVSLKAADVRPYVKFCSCGAGPFLTAENLCHA